MFFFPAEGSCVFEMVISEKTPFSIKIVLCIP